LKQAVIARTDHDLSQWNEDADSLPITAHAAFVDPLVETRALLEGLEAMIALNFKGAAADAVLCMTTTAQVQLAAALAALEKYS
jgi:hypothetical protein